MMAYSTPDTTVIVVSYGTRQLLKDCLDSLRSHAAAQVRVIVVDNHSSDDSVAMVRTEFPEVELMENFENLGFAKANNQALASAESKYVLLLNSDTVVLPGAIQALTEFMDTHPEAGGAACRLLFADGRIQPSASQISSTGLRRLAWRLSGVSRLFRTDQSRRFLRRRLGFALGSTLRSYLDSYATGSSPMEVDLLSGACLLLRTEAVGQVGLLDENFFMYLEDIDYCLRLRRDGWKLYYLPAATVVHLAGQSSGGRMRRFGVPAYQSLFYFYGKHHSRAKVAMARVLVLVASCSHWAWNALRGSLSSDSVYRRNREDARRVIRLCLSWRYSASRTFSAARAETRPGAMRRDGASPHPSSPETGLSEQAQ
jgi:GT2 family glycosyltransferase